MNHHEFSIFLDGLFILSDIDGFSDSNPHENENAKLIKVVTHINDEELEGQHTPNSEFATGGIVTKFNAAKFLMNKNKMMYMSSGFDLKNAYDFLLNGNHLSGTVFKREG